MQTKSLEAAVTFATEKDLPLLKTLADAHRHEIGFVNRASLAEAIAHQEVLCTPLSFLHFHHRRDKISTLYHLCVSPSYRRQGVGRLLVSEWEKYSRKRGMTTLRLKCPLDLEANGFYYRMGFSRVSIEPGVKRSLVIWEKKLLSATSSTPQFVAAFSADGSELQRIFQLWRLGGDLDRNPFPSNAILNSTVSFSQKILKLLWLCQKATVSCTIF